MSLNKKKTERGVFHFSFLEKNEPFLKLDTDLDVDTWGSPIHEIISVNSNELDGIVLNKDTIPRITNMVYNEVVSVKDPRYQVKHNQVRIVLYNLCKIGDVVLFILWQIVAEEISESKTHWESRYSKKPGACCIETYLSTILSDTPSASLIDTKNQALRARSEKKCKFRKRHVKCHPFRHAHFLNFEEIFEANPDLKEIDSNIRLDTSLLFGSEITKTLFCYGGVEPQSVLCHQMYDSIEFKNREFENRNILPYEHNFQNFISDSLYTSLYSQNKIQITFSELESQKQVDPSEHRLLFLTINF